MPTLVITANAQDFDLQATLDQARADNNIVGMGVIVMHADGTYDLAVSGERIKGSGDLIQPDDAWHIGSNTKSMTALLYGRLVEDGLAEWGATIPELFPDYADRIDPAWSNITIEDLFAHRSGVSQLGGFWFMSKQADTRPLSEQRLETTLNYLTKPLAKQVGKYEYNNLGYIVAGTAIEGLLTNEMGRQVTWEEAMDMYVFSQVPSEGASMNWGFGPPQTGIEGHRGVLGTSMFMSGVGKDTTADNPAALGPAGTVHASLLSHALLSREYLRDESPLIPANMREKLFAPYPESDTDASYGMGWGIRQSDHYGTYYSHAGSNTMWYSDIRILPDDDLVIIINSNQFGDNVFDAHQNVLVTILDEYKTRESAD
ncbi:MAG: serine hydrolase domain-containing protein [Pseudomonadota bacterium]